jgi:hypothetical protein
VKLPKRMPGIGFLAALLLAGCAAAPIAEPMPASSTAMQPVMSAMLQGDAREALLLLDGMRAPLGARQAQVADCMRERFRGAGPPIDLPPASAAILAAYRSYWRASMVKTESPAILEARLLEALAAVPALAGGGDPASLDSVSERVVAAIEAEGLHALTGKTEPLYELMIWRTQETRVYDVALPEGSVNVKVVLLDGFASFGWAGYATCEVAKTGGWAKPDALYAVRNAYDLESETFRVSYLAHEGQHFADYRAYPKLEQPELEYRAKLAEIAVSTTTTAQLVERFAASGGESRAVPHAFANRQVTLALQGVAPERLREAARARLLESSGLLARLGPATTARFL